MFQDRIYLAKGAQWLCCVRCCSGAVGPDSSLWHSGPCSRPVTRHHVSSAFSALHLIALSHVDLEQFSARIGPHLCPLSPERFYSWSFSFFCIVQHNIRWPADISTSQFGNKKLTNCSERIDDVKQWLPCIWWQVHSWLGCCCSNSGGYLWRFFPPCLLAKAKPFLRCLGDLWDWLLSCFVSGVAHPHLVQNAAAGLVTSRPV